MKAGIKHTALSLAGAVVENFTEKQVPIMKRRVLLKINQARVAISKVTLLFSSHELKTLWRQAGRDAGELIPPPRVAASLRRGLAWEEKVLHSNLLKPQRVLVLLLICGGIWLTAARAALAA